MDRLTFEWDQQKNEANISKHRVSFEEARTVFHDERALFMPDPDHSSDEERFLLLGISANLRALVVCHCFRAGNDVIRIISARKATKSERTEYNRRWFK